MIANVEFFTTPFSRSNRHFPIFSAGSNTYRTAIVYDVKMNEDLDKIVDVPIFTGWENCNMARIGSNYYWITDATQSTKNKGSCTFKLVFNAVTSVLTPNQSVNAWWDRTPTRRGNIPFTVEPDVLTLSKRGKAPILPKVVTPDLVQCQLFWVEVTFNYWASPGATLVDNSTFCRMGAFVAFDQANAIIDENQMQQCVTIGKWTGGTPGSDYYVGYPSLWEIITDIDAVTGFPPSSIVDISISSRCPYDYQVFKESEGHDSICLFDRRLNGYYPGVVRFFDYDRGGGLATVKRGMYDLDGLIVYGIDNRAFPRLTSPKPISLSLSAMEQDLGQTSLCDELGNRVMQLPSQLGSLSGTVETKSDYNGLYTYIKLNETQQVIRITDGKLPWIGDNWQEYRVRALNADRDALQFAIKQGHDQRNIDIMNSVSNGIVGGAISGGMVGGPAGAVVGGAVGAVSVITSAIGSEAQRRLNERQLRHDQDYKERITRDSAPNFVNAGYGLDYIYGTLNKGLALELDMPTNTTSTEYSNYTAENGYPYAGLIAVTFSGSGYVKGRTPSNIVNGLKGELFNLELVDGFKYQVV